MRNDWVTHLLLTLMLIVTTTGAGASIAMYKHQMAEQESVTLLRQEVRIVNARLDTLEAKAKDQGRLNHVLYSIVVGRSGKK